MTYTENEYFSAKAEAQIVNEIVDLIDNKGDTMTDTTTVTTTIPFSVINGNENTSSIACYENDALILRKIEFGVEPEGYTNAKIKAEQLGWFVRTAHDMQQILATNREDAAKGEREILRKSLIERLEDDGNEIEYINSVLNALNLGTMTRKFEVVVRYGSGYCYTGDEVARFTIEVEDPDVNEDNIRDSILDSIEFDDSEITVDADLTINSEFTTLDGSTYGAISIEVDTSDCYENFDVEVTEV